LHGNDPKPERLVFPRGVRFPRKNEIPGDPTEVLEKIAKARITTGYTIKTVKDKPFKAYLEVNVHAPDVFQLFRNLCFALMPDVASPLIGIKEDEPVFGPYTDRTLALSVFEPFVDLLQNDGFLEFGMLHQSKFAFEEVFVTSPKYFKIWTNQIEVAEKVLLNGGIPKCEELQFIDEYPMVSLSVNKKGSAAWADAFYSIQEVFKKLPVAEIPKSN